MHGRELLQKGILRLIGNGKDTKISDHWLPTVPPRAPRLLPYTNPTLSVDILINQQSGQWDEEILRDFFEYEHIF